MKARIVFLMFAALLLSACSENGGSSAPTVPEFSEQRLSEGRSVWMRTCRNCHLLGVAGAPAINDPKAWEPRREKGEDILYRSALFGKKKDGQWTMPPRGGNGLLSDEQVRKAVDFMLAAVAVSAEAAK